MLARNLLIGKVYNYENHRSKPYRETESGVGVHSVLRPQAVYAKTLPICIEESGRMFIQINCQGNVILRAHCQPLGEPVSEVRNTGTTQQTGTGRETYHGQFRRKGSNQCNRKRPAECNEGQGEMAERDRQGGVQEHVQEFFISLGARFGRIRKTTKGKPSPQLYAYKKEKLQELVKQNSDGLVDLYFGDGSFMCTEGYVPYGWQFPWENVTIESERRARLNIWGMVDYGSRYHGFATTDSMTSEKIADFLDKFSLTIKRETFVVLDNAKVHRSKLMKEMRPIWEKRGLFLFFLPPYSPHLNIAETLWRILKGKWIQPGDYESTDRLFYAVDRSLAALGTTNFVGFSKLA